MRHSRALIGVLAVALLWGCATKTYYTSDKLDRSRGRPTILLMPVDVEMYRLTAGGQLELHGAWTKAAGAHVEAAVRDHLRAANVVTVEYAPPPETSPSFQALAGMQKLHGVVAETIAEYHADENNRLPAKGGRFEWSMGPEVGRLAGDAPADYALFLRVRDSYSTAGRLTLRIVSAVAFGLPLRGGEQVGYATLVDLRSGEVVWSNFLLARDQGDLRTRGRAQETVNLLLNELPE